jgi:LPXTG-motif cell wall-anchored protein
MKKSLKKLTVLLMAVAMVITSMSFTAFAADDTTITVKSVEQGATVKAYQLVKYDSANGKWLNMDGTDFDPDTITADWVTNKAANVSGDGIVLGYSNGEYKSNTNDNNKTEAGLYLVLVTDTKTGNTEYVYNPMIVAVDFDGQELKGGSADAKDNFQIDGQSEAYAKRSKITFDKSIKHGSDVDSADPTADAKKDDKGDTMAPGDIETFVITADIPAYSKAYDNDKLKYWIKDTVSAGLGTPYDIVVKNGNKTLQPKDAEHSTAGTYDYELVGPEAGGKTFTVKFHKSFLISDALKSVTVEYKSELLDSCVTGFDPNTNKAELDYTRDTDWNENHEEDKTYHYTFNIDGYVHGTFKDGEKTVAREIVKTKVDDNGKDVLNVIETETEVQWKERAVDDLEAEFKIYKAKKVGDDWVADGDALQTRDTKDNGRMNFTKLDEGDYVIIESKAPKGYAKNTTPIHVNISAKLKDNGTLESYSVTINDEETSTYKATYKQNSDEIQVVTYDGGTTNHTTEFMNRKVGTLPSTGGMGTILFTVAGIAIMAIAAGLFIANRKASK